MNHSKNNPARTARTMFPVCRMASSYVWCYVAALPSASAVFKLSAKTGSEVERWQDSWSGGPWETILALTKYGTIYQPKTALGLGLQTGVDVALQDQAQDQLTLPAVLTFSKNWLWLNDREGNLIDRHDQENISVCWFWTEISERQSAPSSESMTVFSTLSWWS